MPSPNHCVGLREKFQAHREGYTTYISGSWYRIVKACFIIPGSSSPSPCLPFATWLEVAPVMEKSLHIYPIDFGLGHMTYLVSQWNVSKCGVLCILVIGDWLFLFSPSAMRLTCPNWHCLEVHFSALEAHIHTKHTKKMLTCEHIFHVAVKNWSSFPTFCSLHNPLPHFPSRRNTSWKCCSKSNVFFFSLPHAGLTDLVTILRFCCEICLPPNLSREMRDPILLSSWENPGALAGAAEEKGHCFSQQECPNLEWRECFSPQAHASQLSSNWHKYTLHRHCFSSPFQYSELFYS